MFLELVTEDGGRVIRYSDVPPPRPGTIVRMYGEQRYQVLQQCELRFDIVGQFNTPSNRLDFGQPFVEATYRVTVREVDDLSPEQVHNVASDKTGA